MKRWMKGLMLFLAVVMMAGGSVRPAKAAMLDNGKRIEKIAIFAIEITNRNSDGHNRIS